MTASSELGLVNGLREGQVCIRLNWVDNCSADWSPAQECVGEAANRLAWAVVDGLDDGGPPLGIAGGQIEGHPFECRALGTKQIGISFLHHEPACAKNPQPELDAHLGGTHLGFQLQDGPTALRRLQEKK